MNNEIISTIHFNHNKNNTCIEQKVVSDCLKFCIEVAVLL